MKYHFLMSRIHLLINDLNELTEMLENRTVPKEQFLRSVVKVLKSNNTKTLIEMYAIESSEEIESSGDSESSTE